MTSEMERDLESLNGWEFDFHLVEDGVAKIVCNSLNEKALLIHLFKIKFLGMEVFSKYSFNNRGKDDNRVEKFLWKFKMIGYLKTSSNYFWVRPRFAKRSGLFRQIGEVDADNY